MIIQKQPNPSGAYPAPQSWNSNVPPSGYALIPNAVDMTTFYEYNGFITLTIEGDTVTAYEPNVEAWEEWKASLPEPQPEPPTTEERITELEAVNAELEDAMCEMDAANQTEITELRENVSALEDAVCEMDALNEKRIAAVEDALCEMDMG